MKNLQPVLLLVCTLASLSYAATFIVTNTQDSGAGSLRDALTQSNAIVGADTILFAIPDSDPGFDPNSGAWTITVQSFLPDISDDGLLIDGLSQPEFIGNDTNPFGPEIEISGGDSLNFGLNILADEVHVRHLVLNRFKVAIIGINNTNSGSLQGCYIGTDASGTRAVGKAIHGIELANSRFYDITALDTIPNIIVGSDDIDIFLVRSTHCLIANNIIGLDRSRTKVLDTPETVGIVFQGDADSNAVVNNIVGSPWIGILLSNGSSENEIAENHVGTDETWTLRAGAIHDGIRFWDASDNLVRDNVIGYCKNGIFVNKPTSVRNALTKNSISHNTEKGILNADGGNNMLPAPTVTFAGQSRVEGTAASATVVEIYSDEGNQGKEYLGRSGVDESGNWKLMLGRPPKNPNITAIARDGDGNTSEFSTPLAVGVEQNNLSLGEYTFRLEQNYPNPFNPSTRIHFTLPEAVHVSLTVYNLLGEEVATLINRPMERGEHSVTFHREQLPSGVYFYRIVAGNFTSTKKMALVE